MGDEKQDGADRTEEKAPFESGLKSGRERFLSELIEEVLATGEQSPEDFIRHFPPAAIMQALADQPELRATILIPTTGLKERMALKKSAERAGEDLQMALEEEVTTAAEILEYFKPDHCVQYLPAEALWAFVTDNPFWRESEAAFEQIVEQKEEHRQELVAFVLARALKHNLLTHDQIVNPVIMTGDVSDTLPPEQLKSAVRKGLEAKTPFTSKLLLEAIPLGELIKFVSTKDVWETIVVPDIAVKQDLAPKADEAPTTPPPAEETADGKWDPSVLAEGIDEDNPPQVVAEDIDLDDGDIKEVEDGNSTGDRTSTAGSISDALTKAAAKSGDSPDAEVTIEAGPEVELLDEDGDGDDATTVMESPFADSESQVEDGAFDRARKASDAQDRASSPGSVSSSADLVKKSVIDRLRKAGLKLAGVDGASIKDVIIQTLVELNPGLYGGDKAKKLGDGPTSGLAKVLIRNLRQKKSAALADAVLEDLQTLKAASVVAPNPDPKARAQSKPPRPRKR